MAKKTEVIGKIEEEVVVDTIATETPEEVVVDTKTTKAKKTEKATKEIEAPKVTALIDSKVDALKYLEDNGYPEVGSFEDKKALQKFYKKVPTEILEDWCQVEGLEYKPSEDSESIHRMRVCMAILYKHYPKEPSKSKKKSKYGSYTLEDLITLAIDQDVAVEPTEDERIMRMRTIMALRGAGVID